MASASATNDPSAPLDSARTVAVADARRKADIYATGAGARIGRLMPLTEEPSRKPPIVRYFPRAFAADAAAPPTPIEAGADKLTVNVLARFELTLVRISATERFPQYKGSKKGRRIGCVAPLF
jgi:uncharacterized protein YggE